MAKSARIIPITNSANMEKLGQYRKTRPIQKNSRIVLAKFLQKNSANTEKLGQYDLYRFGQVFLYWPSFSALAKFKFFSYKLV